MGRTRLPGSWRRCRQEQEPRPNLRRPRESEETPPEAKRQRLPRQPLDTQTAIGEQRSEERNTLIQEDNSKTRATAEGGRYETYGILAAGAFNAEHDVDAGYPGNTTSNQPGKRRAGSVANGDAGALGGEGSLPKPMAKLQGRWIPALLDIGAVQSFIHPDLVKQAQLKPIRKEGGITFMGPCGEAVTTSLLGKNVPSTRGTKTCKCVTYG